MTFVNVNCHEISDSVGAMTVVENNSVLGNWLESDLDIQPAEHGTPQPGITEIAGSVKRRYLQRRKKGLGERSYFRVYTVRKGLGRARARKFYSLSAYFIHY